jgi:hypothetical protein
VTKLQRNSDNPWQCYKAFLKSSLTLVKSVFVVIITRCDFTAVKLLGMSCIFCLNFKDRGVMDLYRFTNLYGHKLVNWYKFAKLRSLHDAHKHYNLFLSNISFRLQTFHQQTCCLKGVCVCRCVLCYVQKSSCASHGLCVEKMVSRGDIIADLKST